MGRKRGLYVKRIVWGQLGTGSISFFMDDLHAGGQPSESAESSRILYQASAVKSVQCNLVHSTVHRVQALSTLVQPEMLLFSSTKKRVAQSCKM